MKTSRSDSTTNLVRSLIAAKLKISSAVIKDGCNANFSSQYATLGAVIAATETNLAEEDLVIIQLPGETIDGKVFLTTQLLHSSGEWIEGTCSAPYEYADPQGYGSVLSYLRRYSMTAMLGLYQADDDGNLASGRKANQVVNAAIATATATATAAVATATATASAAKSTAPSDKNGLISDPGAPKVEQWKRSIVNASPERLELAKETAKTIFSDAALKLIQSLIEQHLVVATQTADPFNM